MTRREYVLKALSFEETDRLPKDLGGMLSASISCFAYPKLVAELGLPPRLPRVFDTGQMLALPDLDVLDALDCDVVSVFMQVSNALPQEELWKPYDFNGRLPATVLDPGQFALQEDGTIIQPESGRSMPPASYVFEEEHAGQPLILSADIPKPDLKKVRSDLEKQRLTDADIAHVKMLCEQTREATDRAIFFNGPGAGIGIAAHTGIAMFPMLCMTEPDFVHELHEMVVSHAEEQIGLLLSEIHPYVDIYNCGSDDWGTQNQTIAAPQVYRDLFQPYYRRINDLVHRLAPNAKTFLHSCGAIYDLIDDIIDSGFDILNPVQWTAGGHSYKEWKDKSRGRISLWGGGVNAQHTLPLGTVEDVEAEVREIISYMRTDGGFIFNGIHNLLAETDPKKIVAMYRTAAMR